VKRDKATSLSEKEDSFLLVKKSEIPLLETWLKPELHVYPDYYLKVVAIDACA
jgi:hypothetical protein